MPSGTLQEVRQDDLGRMRSTRCASQSICARRPLVSRTSEGCALWHPLVGSVAEPHLKGGHRTRRTPPHSGGVPGLLEQLTAPRCCCEVSAALDLKRLP